MRGRVVCAAAVLPLVVGCGAEGDPGPRVTAGATPTTAASEPAPRRSAAAPSPSSSSSSASPSALGEPRTDVPESVMLTSELERTADTTDVRAWALRYCGPEPGRPDAAAMRTRSFAGPPTDLEAGRLEYAQQVAAFPSVDAAVAEADRLAALCGEPSEAVLPRVSELRVGAQGRLVVFAEGGDYSIGGVFRRGNAVAVVQGQGGEADRVVRDALRETFDRMCVYDRPEGC